MVTYEDFLEEWKNDKEYVTCHTSGSTGSPKEIKLPKGLMEESAMRTIRHFNLESCSHLHSCISPEFIGGKMMAVRSQLSGARLTWEKPSNRPLREYSGGAIDLLAVVPSQMLDLLDHLPSLPAINALIIGGAPISAAIRTRIAESGLNAWETYGMTETASHIALRRVCSEETSFTPLSGIAISTDPDNRLVINLGKWGIYLTNDIAEIDKNGNFRILGRYDNVIITGGRKVHPEQIEQIIEPLTGCDILVRGERDDKWGEIVTMTVDCTTEMDATEILDLCRKNLSFESVPKKIIIREIPRTPNGKKKREI